MAALLAGEVDVIEVVPPEDVLRLEQEEDVRVEIEEGYGGYFFVMNIKKPPFDDVRVRQAVNYAIDWDEIMELFGGYAYRRPLPCYRLDFGYAEYADDLMQYAYDYDPDKARELLAEAGYPDGFEVTIETGTGFTKAAEVTQAVAAQLAEVGIKAKVEVYERLVYYNERYKTGNLEMGMFVMGNPISDPDHLMAIHFDPDRAVGVSYRNPKLTELAHRGVATVDPKERVEIYREALQLVLEEAAYAWGYGTKLIYGVRADINWKPRVDVRMYPHDMSFVKK